MARDKMIPVHIGSCINYWENMTGASTIFGISATFVSKKGDNVSMSWNAADVFSIFKHRWMAYKMYMSKTVLTDWMIFSGESAEDAAANRFANEWQMWKLRNLQNLEDQYAAYVEGYDPLVNNFFKEELTEGHQLSSDNDQDSWSNDYAETTTYGKVHKRNDTETSATGDVTQYTYGVGSDASGSPESRTSPQTATGAPNNAHVGTDSVDVSNTGATAWRDNGTVDVDDGSDTKSYSGTHTMTYTKANTQGLAPIGGNPSTSTERYHDTHDLYHTREGNMGEMTSQAMLREELELRKHDLLAEFIKQFITDTCVFTNDAYFEETVDYYDDDFIGL